MDYKKFIVLGILLILIWSSFLFLIINYGETLRKHPCQICSEKIGENVVCSNGQYTMTFSENSIKKESVIKWGNWSS